MDTSGGGELNTFGSDFDRYNLKYTIAFCMEDSDKDGVTNGAELGDPCCTWQKGDEENNIITSELSHPGLASDTTTNPALLFPNCGDSNGDSIGDSNANSNGDSNGSDNSNDAGSGKDAGNEKDELNSQENEENNAGNSKYSLLFIIAGLLLHYG